MSEKKESDTKAESSPSTPSESKSKSASTPASPASVTKTASSSSSKDAGTPTKGAVSNPPSPASSSSAPSSTKAASTTSSSSADKKAADSTVHKRDSSGSALSSLKASLDKAVPKAASVTSESTASSPSPAASTTSSSSSGTDWASRLTFGLASSKQKADITEWLPDLSDKLPPSLFTQPPTGPDGAPAAPALPAEQVTAEFPNFVSLLHPLPPPSSALRFGWIDEYGDYHATPSTSSAPSTYSAGSSSSSARLNPKVMRAREQARDLLSSIMQQQERLEKDKEPGSPRMSAVVKEKLALEGAAKDVPSMGVDRLVQVVEGAKGEKKVVVTEEEKVHEDL